MNPEAGCLKFLSAGCMAEWYAFGAAILSENPEPKGKVLGSKEIKDDGYC